jgi:hypothetical protein
MSIVHVFAKVWHSSFIMAATRDGYHQQPPEIFTFISLGAFLLAAAIFFIERRG